jgi:hypothetical protein
MFEDAHESFRISESPSPPSRPSPPSPAGYGLTEDERDPEFVRRLGKEKLTI